MAFSCLLAFTETNEHKRLNSSMPQSILAGTFALESKMLAGSWLLQLMELLQVEASD